MKTVCWNCRGIDTTAVERALLDVQKQWGPDVFFLSETHLNTARAKKLRKNLNMDHVEVVESVRASGGLLLFWRKSVVLEVMGKTKKFIDVKVGDSLEESWRLTGFYGEPKWEDRSLTWDYLRGLYLQHPYLGCHRRFQ